MIKLKLATPILTAGYAMYPFKEALAEKFSCLDRFGEPYSLFREQGVPGEKNHMILLPRAVCPLGASDKRVKGVRIPFAINFTPRNDEQARVVNESCALLDQEENFIINAPTGFGKSHPKGTKVLRWTGEFVNVEDVKEGDLLMGPDSKPRIVTNTHKGFGRIYRIIPNKGEAWECNEPHVLSLVCTGNPKFGGYKKGDLVNIPLDEYLTKSKTFKHCFKLWKTGVEFPSVPIPLEAYFAGLYAGDGSRHHPCLTVGDADEELLDYLLEWANANGIGLRPERGRGCTMYYMNNLTGRHPLCRFNQWFCGQGEKLLPQCFVVNSREVRLQTLAGLLDADGHLVRDTVFELSVVSFALSEQIAFLGRSLGFNVSQTVVKDARGVVYRSFISGNTEEIPCKLPRKKANARRQKKHQLVTGFVVEYMREDYYYGIALNGDHLYLLKDFTVTHNTIVGATIIGHYGRKALIIVDKSDTLGQWREALSAVLGLDPGTEANKYRDSKDIGYIQGDLCNIAGKKVCIGMVHSVCKRGRYPDWVYREFGFLLADEVDIMGADTFSEAMWLFPGLIRVGMSATIKRSDGRDKIFQSHIGKVLVKSEQLPMIPKVIRVKTSFRLPRIKRRDPKTQELKVMQLPHTPGRLGQVYSLMAGNEARNQLIIDFMVSAYHKGRLNLALSDLKEKHLDRIYNMLVKEGVPRTDIGYYVGGMKEAELEESKHKPIILGTCKMCSRATNIPWVDTYTMLTPHSDVTQLVGRAIREHPGKKQPVVFDPVDLDSNVLKGYAETRLKWYLSIGAKIVEKN